MEQRRCALTTLAVIVLAQAANADLSTTIDLALVSPTATLTGGYALGWGGSSLSIADVNGDNWPDIIVASCLAEPLGGLRKGELTIVWGGYPSLSGSISLASSSGMSHIYGPVDGDPIYCSVASGDFNGDGFDDILWGHPRSPAAERNGKVYMIPGRDAFPAIIDLEAPPNDVVLITGHDSGGYLGTCLRGADFNGDGIDDLVLSAPGMINAEVYVIAGSSCLLTSYWTGTDAPGMTRMIDAEQYRNTGYSVAVGDIDMDGRDDLVLGAPGNAAPNFDGRIRVLYGAPNLGDSIYVNDARLRPKVVMPEFSNGQLGQDVAIGDIDNDDQLDIAISAVTAGALGCTACGAAYVIRNIDDAPNTIWLGTYPVTRLYGSGYYTYYGLHLAFGDMDGDHKDDLAISNWPILENQRGRTVIAFASAMTSSTHMLASDPGFTRIIEKKIGDSLGSSLATADLNRDGLDDLLVGAFQADPPSAGNAGEVYLINGCYVPSAIPSVAPAELPEPIQPHDRD
jgi:hypothetical protein